MSKPSVESNNTHYESVIVHSTRIVHKRDVCILACIYVARNVSESVTHHEYNNNYNLKLYRMDVCTL